jgi:hypothetical protein
MACNSRSSSLDITDQVKNTEHGANKTNSSKKHWRQSAPRITSSQGPIASGQRPTPKGVQRCEEGAPLSSRYSCLERDQVYTLLVLKVPKECRPADLQAALLKTCARDIQYLQGGAAVSALSFGRSVGGPSNILKVASSRQ